MPYPQIASSLFCIWIFTIYPNFEEAFITKIEICGLIEVYKRARNVWYATLCIVGNINFCTNVRRGFAAVVMRTVMCIILLDAPTNAGNIVCWKMREKRSRLLYFVLVAQNLYIIVYIAIYNVLYVFFCTYQASFFFFLLEHVPYRWDFYIKNWQFLRPHFWELWFSKDLIYLMIENDWK